MKVKILKDATVTISAGQIVEIPDVEARAAIALGLAAEHKETKKRGAAK